MATVEELTEQLKKLQQQVSGLQASCIQQPATVMSTLSQLPPPDKFTFQKEDWQVWIKHYERYRTATKMNASDEKTQINSLCLHMGPQITKFLQGHLRTEEGFKTYTEMKEFLDDKFTKSHNLIYARAKFNMRNQKQGETAEE